MKRSIEKYVIITSAYLVGVVFLLAGVNKILHYSLFVDKISTYSVIPSKLMHHLAFPLILAEIWVGVGLFIGPWRKLAAMTSSAFLFLFIFVLSIGYLSGVSASCSCMLPFGNQTIGLVHIIQDVFFLGLSILVWSKS